MGRKREDVVIVSGDRDNGKMFRLTEMSASQAERWAARAISGMARAGVEVPEQLGGLDLMALAVLGLRALGSIPFAEAEPLLDEMMTCVQFVDVKHPDVARGLIEDDIEEVATRLYLRRKVFALHVDFSGAVGDYLSALTARLRMVSSGTEPQTSREPSPQSSPPGSPAPA